MKIWTRPLVIDVDVSDEWLLPNGAEENEAETDNVRTESWNEIIDDINRVLKRLYSDKRGEPKLSIDWADKPQGLYN